MKGAHESLEAHEAVRASSDRAFGVVFFLVFSLIAGHALWTTKPWWPFPTAIALAFGALAWIKPVALAPLNRLWLRVGMLLHRVVNPVVMAIMFFGVVLPTGLLMRFVGKDPLRLQRDPKADSYWQPRAPAAPDHFRDPF